MFCLLIKSLLIHFTKSRACLDTSYEGNLSESKLMGVYRETHDVGTLSEADQLSYCVNIYPEDNILEIVSMCCKYMKHAFVWNRIH